MARPRHRVGARDVSRSHQTRQRFLERDRPRLAGDRDLLVQVLQRILADVLPGAVARSSAAPPPARGRRRSWAAASAIITAESASDSSWRMVFCRSLGNESQMRPIGGRDVGGVQAAEHQVAGLGGRRARCASTRGRASRRSPGCRAPAGRRRAARWESPARRCRPRPARSSPAWCACSYSIGSSTVMMCLASRRLMASTSAARVVVLPEPVAPPISTSPRPSRDSCSTSGGRFSSASDRHAGGQHADGRRRRGRARDAG